MKADKEEKKKHKKAFNTDLNIDEYEEMQKLLEKHNMTKVNLVRYAIKKLKEEN